MVWMNQQEKTSSVIVGLKPNAKQTGWIVSCEDFDAFMWNSDKLLHQLVVAITVWADEGNGKALVVEADSKEKRGFTVKPQMVKNKAVETAWSKIGNGFKVGLPEDEADTPNPFL